MTANFTTLTEFILEEEKKFNQATGQFTLLLAQIQEAAKIIASHIRKSGLVDIIGETGKKNAYEEEVKKLDEFSNNLIVQMLSSSGYAHTLFSEELAQPVVANNKTGEYVIFFDPLDGSSNIDVGISVGTIFSVYKKTKAGESLIQKGVNQIAAGYILYGSSVIFVFTCGNGINGFTLDPAIGTFLLSHPNIKIPSRGNIYTMNESYWRQFHDYQKKYLSYIKEEDKETGRPYNLRYAACMVADVHRILIDGGIFIYPENKKKPQGKLRLMYEVNPMSYIVKQAGGKAISLDKDPLTIDPSGHDQTVPVALGSRENVNEYLQFFQKR